MDPLVNVLLAIDQAHTVPQRAYDCGPGLGGLNQVYGDRQVSDNKMIEIYLWHGDSDNDSREVGILRKDSIRMIWVGQGIILNGALSDLGV